MFNKKMGKKVVVALLTLSMVATMCGCGKNNKKNNNATKEVTTEETTDTDNTKEETSTEETSTASDKKTKISIYRACFNIAAPDTEEVKKVQDAINDYIGDKINVEVELHDISSAEYRDKANLALVGGEIDLLWTASWQETIGCDDVVKQNAVYDITDMLPNYDIYTALPDWVWGSAAYSGKNYFVPVYKESAEGYDIAFRKDLVDKYGWDISSVKSIKDIEPMLADCKAEGLKYPYLTQRTAMFYRYYLDKFDFFSQDSFMAVDKEKNEVVNILETPEYKEFCTLMGDWADKGYLHEDDLTKTTNDTTTQSKDWGVTWWTDVPNNAEANVRWKQDAEMVKVTDNWLQSNGTLGSCYCISSKCSEAEADACLKFLSLLYTDQTVANLYTFGIEGVDYNMEDGAVAKVDGAGYNHSMWESTTVTVLPIEKGEPENKVQMYADFNNGAKDSVADGFRFDFSAVETQYLACQQVFQEFGYVLENGGYAAADVEAGIKGYQDALDAAGFQDVLATAQQQYTDWLAVK
ncbi:ABC transporter substrate-binding protein [Anaerosporobacter faecicola]|uniref:ABC transporter substrate-binding protein n=1 Tax=Anaerosporobacter faecicola TaxID=2718714 RepID=UPI00143BCB2C|nr:ABC transporter substrate-binding protein [Anaerosporobacter faecicola]